MDKKRKELDTKQPLVKNVSLLGATMMLSSSVVIPGLSVTALAEENINQGITDPSSVGEIKNNQSDVLTPAMELGKVESEKTVIKSDETLDLSLTLNALRQDNLNTLIQVSPNVMIQSDVTKNQVKDETGRVVGTYQVDTSLNQVMLQITETGFTQSKLIVPITFKKADLTEQVVTVSIGDSMSSLTVGLESVETEENVSEEPIEPIEETSTESSASSTSTSEEISTESSASSTSATSTSEETSTENSASSTSTTSTSEETSTESSASSTSTTSTSEETSTESSASSTSTGSSTTEQRVEKAETKAKTQPKKEQPVRTRVLDPAPKPVPMSRAATPQAAFIENTAYHAQDVAAKNGLYASVMIAQAILESGYGNSTLSSPPNHNLFGIKGSYNGQSVTMPTWEYINGQNITVNAQFRKYPSYRQSFEDNARVLKTTSFYPGVYFYSGTWKANTNSYRDATAWLTGRYATDPNYNTKLNNLIVTHNLTQYDTPGSSNGSKPTTGNTNTSNSNTNNTNNNQNTTTHTVQRGDTLYGISLKYGVSVGNLKAWNNLSSDTIYVGQKLKVKGGSTSTSKPTAPSKPNQPSKPSEPTKPTTDVGTYTVQRGDTLYGIGGKKGVSVGNLKAWNNLSSDTIYVGQKLKVTGSSKSPSKPTQQAPVKPNQSTSTSTYTVQRGDTLYGIGGKHGVSVGNLKTWNNLSSDTIYVGQKLKVIGSSAPSSKPAQPTKPSQSSPSGSASTYTVQRGDSLYAIGLKHNVSVANIKKWNHLNSDLIYVGQKLVLTGANANTNTNKQPVPSKPATSGQTAKNHVVQRGDTLYGISLRYGVSSSDIKKWNDLSSDLIYIGQKLVINGGQSSNQSSTKKTQATQSSTYIVKTGDTLYKIALSHKTSVPELKTMNNLTSDLIYVGQTLKITTTNQSTTKSATNSKTKRHSVQSGDTLWGLSDKYQVSVLKLKQWNHLTSDVIYKGQNLKVG